MIIAIDTETRGLDCTKFICGTIVKENTKKAEVFYNKEDMWKRIIDLGVKESRRGKPLNVYAHNMQYDFYAIADLQSKRLTWYSTNPFIVAYTHRNKEIIKFLDTLSLYKMSLEKAGKLIGMQKGDTPKELYNDKDEISEELMKNIVKYMIQDARICLNLVLKLKKKLKESGINVKRLYTISQIAINYVMNELKKGKYEFIFWNVKKGETRRTFRDVEIHSAYRGGRVECFKTGEFKDLTYLDINSLYPYSACNIRFPDLKSERLYKTPEHNIINRIGVSKVLLYNKTNKMGVIPIRTENGNYFPKDRKYIIGTYTHMEIRKAIEEGYKLISIEWSVAYNDAPLNPLKDIMTKLYSLRDDNEFNRYFYKNMMNRCIGKMAQNRRMREMFVDNIENAEQHLKENSKIVKGFEYNYMYSRESKTREKKLYYMPIIPTLINAYARLVMYNNMKKIKLNDLIYTDTDSIIFKGDYINQFNIGTDIGEFKVEHEKVDGLFYGKKAYSIGKEIKVSGINTRDVKIKQFKSGKIKSKKMITIKTTSDINKVGTFREEVRDLNDQEELFTSNLKEMNEQGLFVDKDIDDISFFVDKIGM